MKQPVFDFKRELSENVLSRFFIAGQWSPVDGALRRTLIDPSTEAPMCDVPLASFSDIDHAVAAARQAFDLGPWAQLSGPQRATHLRLFAEIVNDRLPLLTRLWTAQVGAPVAFAGRFSGFAPAMLDYYAQLAETFEFTQVRETFEGKADVIRQPVGVVALIAPWNAQLPILAYKLGAALAAGCTVIIKSPPESPFDALVLAECAEEAGIPDGVINVVTADRDEGAYLVASHGVDKVSFTGSTAVGKTIANVCIQRMARFTLELGGKSAAIILDDADLQATVGALAHFSMPFSGQICFAQTRLLVPQSRHEEFVSAYTQAIASLAVGDPWDDTTHLGPVASATQYERVLAYIQSGLDEGARIVTGGSRAKGHGSGFFIEPTVFVDVTPEMTIARQEIFGPVVVIMAYEDDAHALRLANDSDFGLSGSVFSTSTERAAAFARQIKTGNVTINGLQMAPNVPFGGFKQSGMGREGGPEGLDAFLESQAIYLPSV
ncbi:aldehyde dehydrogenase [Pseudomonas sp. HN11]|uniref:aldehyde dehydrogenase n=1 Tax=Pseudomonas sp. HN11 TaxID=1344094 RepID=UPI001F387932|nr:aldehyde dehydrogenase [Pseudomonas sp. HN11]UII69874.1 aldehyde dehydrogenase [Pseudomonas sp. HN11]